MLLFVLAPLVGGANVPFMTAEGVRRLCDAVAAVCGGRCAVFSGTDGEGYKYAVSLPGGDLRALVKALNTGLNGRGGGKPTYAQGRVAADRQTVLAALESMAL